MKKLIPAIGFTLFLGILLFAYLFVSDSSRNEILDDTPVETYFYSTKNDADCILITQGNKHILIDTGEEIDAQGIVKFLRDKEVSKIDYIVLTHSDKDHIGGFETIAENFEIGSVIKPYYANSNEAMENIDSILQAKDIASMSLLHKRSFSVGRMSMVIYPPLEKRYSNDNNYSIAVMIIHKDVKMLFAGDAVKKRLDELLQINWPKDIQLLKIPHHGRQAENSAQFIEKINPRFAVVTSNNADLEIKNACAKTDTELFYTLDKNLKFISDGKSLKLEEVN